MSDLAGALRAWRDVLGADHVLTDTDALTAAHTATFATTQRLPAILRPGSRTEVQECVRIANAYRMPIYPVSGGKNWGYGSRVPVQDGCVLLDLARLNRILDYDEKLAYVTVEPGVTFHQVFELLQARQSGLLLAVTGSTPEASVIGNTVERGVGSGPYSDRFEHVCGLEVVLPTGQCIHTGFTRFPKAQTAQVARWGVGPSVDGLFTQSNLGIVTKMTLWLAPAPAYFQACFFTIDEGSALGSLVDTLQTLKLKGPLSAPVTLWNDCKLLSVMQRYPWAATAGKTPLPTELRAQLRAGWWNSAWCGWAGLYSTSSEQGQIERKIVAEVLSNQVDKLVFADETDVTVYRCESPIDLRKLTFFLRALNLRESSFFGVPTERGIASTYWRKPHPVPASMDPDRDGCGIIWCAPLAPFEGQHVHAVVELMEATMAIHQFEPIISLTGVSGRCVHIVAAVIYDRSVEGEDARARDCHDEMLRRLIAAGYLPYRLGIQSMGALPPVHDDWDQFLHLLKNALDPHNILAPGRYDGQKVVGASRQLVD